MSERPVPPRPVAAGVLDVVVVLALVGLALLGLSTTYADAGYLVVGLVAAAAGALVSLLTVRLPMAVLVAVLPIGAILLGGPVALRDTTPDLHTLADVMQGSATGWGELLTTLPGVDVAGPPALVPFLLGYLGAALAVALALRTRSAGVPVLPLLVVLVVVLLLRRPGSDGAVGWSPVAFACLALAWCVVRGLVLAPGGRDVRGAAHGRLTRAVTAGLVVAAALALAVPLTSGSPSSAGETLRGRTGGLPDVAGLDSPLRRFRTFTDQPPGTANNVHRKLLFTVEGAPAGSRVRLLTLDRYDGREWRPANHSMRGADDDAFLRMDTTVENPTRGPHLRARVRVARAYGSAWVPTVGSLTSLRLLFADPRARRSELRYDLATSTAVLPTGLARGDAYEFTGVLPDDRLTPRMRAWSGPVLSVAGAAQVRPVIRDLAATPAPPMSKVFAMARYLRTEGRYSDGGPGQEQYAAGHDLERLVPGFLRAPRPVGDDEQYASAMAVLANHLGVPARVVVGAVVPRDGKVRGEDVHAWVELRVADGSWRTLPTSRFMSSEPPRRAMGPAPRPEIPPALTPQEPEQRTQPEIRREEQARQQSRAERRSLVLRAAPWLGLLALALVVPAAKLVRRTRRRRRGRPSDRVAGAWTELVDHARDLGLPVRATASRPAQARDLDLGDPAHELSHRADEGVFAPGEPDEDEVRAYWSAVQGERRRLGEGRPLRHRLWAPFNPVTLVRRPGAAGPD